MSAWTIYTMGVAHGLALALLTLWLSYRHAKRSLAQQAKGEGDGGDNG